MSITLRALVARRPSSRDEGVPLELGHEVGFSPGASLPNEFIIGDFTLKFSSSAPR